MRYRTQRFLLVIWGPMELKMVAFLFYTINIRVWFSLLDVRLFCDSYIARCDVLLFTRVERSSSAVFSGNKSRAGCGNL